MTAKHAHPFPRVVPPQGFTTIHCGCLYRALDTLEGEHLAFIKRLKLGSVLVLSPILDESFRNWVENEEIALHCILSNNHDLYHGDTASLGRALPFGGSSIGVSEDWMKSALELLFSLSRDPVLIVGSALSCVDAALIACVRRIQRWSLTSVLAEFRQVTGRKIFDLEQFIEFFDVSIVQIPSHRMPSYLDIFLKVENFEIRCNGKELHADEELFDMKDKGKKDKDKKKNKEKDKDKDKDKEKDKEKKKDKEKSGAPSGGDDGVVSAHILRYADWNLQQQLCITSLSQFDPNLSLVTDDVTDD